MMLMTWDSSAPPTDNERPPVTSLPAEARPYLRIFVPPPPVYVAQKPRGPSKLVNLRGLLGRLRR